MSEWQLIETAPKDGTHILVCNATIPFTSSWTFNQRPPAVVHWWDWEEDESGFYLSSGGLESDHPFNATHWMPLPKPPMVGVTWSPAAYRPKRKSCCV